MPTLADTSVWIEHLRKGSAQLADMLKAGEVCCHPFVIGELACGRLTNRKEILALLSALPGALVAEHEEVMDFLTERQLAGRGLGWIDAHLLASACLSRCRLWTLDKALRAAARELRIDG